MKVMYKFLNSHVHYEVVNEKKRIYESPNS